MGSVCGDEMAEGRAGCVAVWLCGRMARCHGCCLARTFAVSPPLSRSGLHALLKDGDRSNQLLALSALAALAESPGGAVAVASSAVPREVVGLLRAPMRPGTGERGAGSAGLDLASRVQVHTSIRTYVYKFIRTCIHRWLGIVRKTSSQPGQAVSLRTQGSGT